jgi:DNA-binding winged helix-turn-helix (wHTH) protein
VGFEFGPFRLDEPGRILWLAEREVPLQPRVFDLLAYLIRSRERVVSKDELLDALWPGVTVTDNSLQRAVSLLRSALREGGMEDAVRNYPRAGYRFGVVADGESSDQATAVGPVRSRNQVNAARRAAAAQRWDDVVALYADTDAEESLAGQDLDRWAAALQCLGRPAAAIPLLVRAVAAHTEAGANDPASAAAVTLSVIHFERGEVAVCKGWAARARSLVAADPDSLATGRVLWLESRIAAFDGDQRQALGLAEAAYEFGKRLDDVTSKVLGLMYRGFYRLSLGDTRGGLADQDHAAAIALSSKVDPITGGVLYCNILWACRTFGDWARANQWTIGYQQFCNDNSMGFSGSCQLHRAEVLGIRGSLHDALVHIKDALARLGDDAPWALADAYRVLGDIHHAIGDADAAQAAYEKCYSLGWSPEPGQAMLLLEQGDANAAYASLERGLLGQSWWTLQRQGILLAHLAVVAVHAGRFDDAQALIDDLSGQDERWPMPSIRALTNEAASLLARNRGDGSEALRYLYLAQQLWMSVESRMHASRLRLQIADVQLELGDRRSAAAEIRAAMVAADELGSEMLRRQGQELQRRLA